MGRRNTLYLIALGCLMVSMSAQLLLMPAKTFSDEENRYLAQLPVLSWERIRSGEFGEQLERYIADQFPLRERWVALKAWTEIALQKKENNGVYAGKDQYLLEKLPEPAVSIQTQASYVKTFADKLDVPVYVLLAPNSASVLSDKLPRYAPVPDQSAYIAELFELLGDAVEGVNPYPVLSDHRDEDIYYRTDHHWSTLGAYYAYRVFAERAGLEPLDREEFRLKRASESFYGTLTAKSKYRHIKPDAIDLWIPQHGYDHTVTHLDDGQVIEGLYDWEKLNYRDQYPVFLGGNHALTHIETPEAPDKTLLLIKDSYAHSIVPFLALHYEHIYMADLRYLNMSLTAYAAEIGADEVLLLYHVAGFQSDTQLVKLGW